MSEFAQLVAACEPRPWIAQLCRVQRRVALSSARWKAVTTSRRAGKTVQLVAELADALEDCQRGEVVIYLAKTRATAKELAWDKFAALGETYKLGWHLHVSDLRIETARGGALLLRGAEGSDAEKERQKIRGLKVRKAGLDEAQSYASTIKRLLRETIEPALGDLRGSCTVAGTPGEVMAGGWYRISRHHEGCEAKWSRFHWTVRENDFFSDAEGYLAAALGENGWAEDAPTYQREYEGLWCADDSVQVYRYLATRNDVSRVDGYALEWPHAVGVDFGETDACAWTVLANRPNTAEVYAVRSFKRRGLKPADCADITGELVERYTPDVLVGDGGNLGGNVYIDAINARLGERTKQRMLSAQKIEKRAYIELCNGDLRSGRVKFLQPDTDELTSELETLPWANEARLKEHAGHDNHCSDSFLYAWRHFSDYLGEAPLKRQRTEDLLPGEPGYEEWLERMESSRVRDDVERPWWAR